MRLIIVYRLGKTFSKSKKLEKECPHAWKLEVTDDFHNIYRKLYIRCHDMVEFVAETSNLHTKNKSRVL